MAWVEIEWPPGGKPVRKDLVKGGLIFGRSPESEVVLDDAPVSAKHAWVREVDGRCVLIDLHSTNGVTLNGRKVEEAGLHDGDTFCLADVVCHFHDDREKAAREAQAEPRPFWPESDEGPADQCPACGYLVPGHLEFCPRCRQSMKGVRPVPDGLAAADVGTTRKVVRALSSLAFAGGLVGPLLLGVGWALGIVLGVIILSGYRDECEPRDVRMARRGILLGLLWLAAMLWAFYFFH